MMMLVLSFPIVSCKDKRDLDGAGDEIYITMTPRFPNLELKVGAEPIEMSCIVKNYAGEIIPTEVKWSSDQPEIARFIDGTNKLIAVSAKEDTQVMIRATLPNGRYAVTKAKVSRWRGEGLELLAAPVKIDESKDAQTGEVSYSAKIENLANKFYLKPDGTFFFLVKLNPVQMIEQEEIVFEGVDEKLFSIKEFKLDANTDLGKKRIAVTPKGAKWFRFSVIDNKRFENKEVVVKVAGSKVRMEQKFVVSSGTVLDYLAFDEAGEKRSATKIVNLGAKDTVAVYSKFDPLTDVDLENVKREIKWTLKNATGGGCLIEKLEYDEYKEAFIAVFKAGNTSGSATIVCSYQGQEIACNIAIVDLQTVAYEGLAISDNMKKLLSDLYVGETIPLQVKILPKKSTAFLQKELRYKIEGDEVVSISEKNGSYSILGVKAGQCTLVFSLRGKELRVPVVIKAAVKAINIDNTTADVVMLGDELLWRANITMMGTDKPNYAKLVWNAKPSTALKLMKDKTDGVRIKALKLEAGQELVEIEASYRGMTSTRKLTIVPVQPSSDIKTADLDLSIAGVTKEGGVIKVLLTPKSGSSLKENIELNLKAKQGATKLEAKTYTAEDYRIDIIWNNAHSVKKLAEAGSSITLVASGNNRYNLKLNLATKVGSKTITVKGAVDNLEKY